MGVATDAAGSPPRSLVGRVRASIGTSFATMRAALANASLRRLQIAWAASTAGEAVSIVAFGVVAYHAGGATAVGLVGVVQVLPNAALGPFAALLGDRFRRERVVVVSDLVRCAALAGGAAVVAVDAPVAAVYVLAAVLAVANAAFYPAQAGLVPLLARSTGDVTAAVSAASLIRNFAALAAPAAAGVVLLAWSEAVLFAVGAVAFATGAVVLRGIPGTDAVRSAPAAGSVGRALADGFRAAAREREVSVVLGTFFAHSVARGAVGVLVVVVPLELLGTGSAGVGFMSAVLGLGAFVGAVATTGLAGRRRLAGPMAVGLLVTGVPLLAAGALTAAPLVVAAIAAVGAGFALVSTTGTTLLVRSVRDDLLSRVLGVLGTVRAAGVALGAALTPFVAHTAGLRWALAATGGVALTAYVAGRGGLRTIDTGSAIPERELGLLRSAPVFAPMLPVALERLAARLEAVRVPAGTTLIREGEEGDAVFVVAEGQLVAESSGVQVGRLGAGDVVGEMAPLRGTRRNATVRAVTDCQLYRLTRDEFLATVLGHPESSGRAYDLVTARLAALEGRVCMP